MRRTFTVDDVEKMLEVSENDEKKEEIPDQVDPNWRKTFLSKAVSNSESIVIFFQTILKNEEEITVQDVNELKKKYTIESMISLGETFARFEA